MAGRSRLASALFQSELGRDGDGGLDRSRDRALLRVDAVDALRRLPVLGRELQPVADVNSLEDEDASLDLDLADGRRDEPLVPRGNLTRLQRASEGARQSPRGGGDDIVDRRRVRVVYVRVDLVVLGDGPVDAEEHGLSLGREVGAPERPLHPLDADFGSVGYVRHAVELHRLSHPIKSAGPSAFPATSACASVSP
jgi:hypothetical protein